MPDTLLHGLSHQPINPSKVTGLLNRLSGRFELVKVFGSRGVPQENGALASGTEATREIADPDLEVGGTNASSDDVTYYAEGGIKLETDGANNDQVIILPHLDATQSAWAQVTWGTDKQTEWECLIGSGSSVADVTLFAGLKLTNTSVVATDNDQVFFRVTAAGNWQAIYSIGGTDTTTDTGVTVAASTTYHLVVKIDADRKARFFLNDVLVATSTALTDATDLIPYIGIHANTGSAKHMYAYAEAISRVIG